VGGDPFRDDEAQGGKERAMSMRAADLAVAVIILAIGVLAGLDAIRLGYGWAMEGPRAGFFPFILALLIIGGCLYTIWQALQRKGVARSNKPLTPPEAVKPILTVLIPAVLMLLFTEIVGLYVAAIVYLTGYIKWVGEFRWRTALLIGVLVPVAFYIVFDKIFLIPMPQGMFGARLGF
jgi:hypothetical protein